MKTFWLILVLSFVVIINANAATLKFTAVESTADCTIAGYIVWCGTTLGSYDKNKNIGNVTEYLNVETEFNLRPDIKYYFVVNAYSDKNQQGLMSNVAEHIYIVPDGELPPDNVGTTIITIPGTPGQVIINIGIPQ